METKGFSIIELLIVVAIIPILALISFKFIGDQQKKNYRTVAQSSMNELMSLMKVAQKNDGGYHQFIYQMGYRPKGILIANIGVKAGNTAPCGGSSDYPALGGSCSKKIGGTAAKFPIAKGERCPEGTKNKSGTFTGGVCQSSASCECEEQTSYKTYTYYNCGNSNLDKATDVKTICSDSSYSHKDDCVFKKLPSNPSDLDINSSTNFGSCNSKAVCNYNNISLVAISASFDEKMVLSHTGSFCMD